MTLFFNSEDNKIIDIRINKHDYVTQGSYYFTYRWLSIF